MATGHHLRDQAETYGIFLIRPQLDIAPESLRDYLRKNGVQWIEDPMNQDEDFARVKIRKFLPKLAEIGLDEKRLSETAATLLRTRSFLQEKVDAFLSNHVRIWDNVVAALSWKRLQQLPQEIAMPVLGQLLQRIGEVSYVPEAAELQRILECGDEFRGCTLGHCELLTAMKRLWIVPQDKTNRLMTRQEWESFVKLHPVYRHCGFPYKVRRALKDKIRV